MSRTPRGLPRTAICTVLQASAITQDRGHLRRWPEGQDQQPALQGASRGLSDRFSLPVTLRQTRVCLIILVLQPKNPGHVLTQVSRRPYQNQRERLDPPLQEPDLPTSQLFQRYSILCPEVSEYHREPLPCMPEKTEASAFRRAPPHSVGAAVTVSGVSTEHSPCARHCDKCTCHYLTYSS